MDISTRPSRNIAAIRLDASYITRSCVESSTALIYRDDQIDMLLLSLLREFICGDPQSVI